MENLDVITPEQIIDISEEKGLEFKNIETNQIRNFFAAIVTIKKKVEMMENFDYSKVKTDIMLLKPKIAYAAGRKSNVKPFKDFIDEVIKALTNSKNHKKAVESFINLMDAVVAYHKFYSKGK